MRQKWSFYVLIFIALLVFTLPTTWATPFTVTVDISSLTGLDIELEFNLFDSNGIVGDSSVWIDNVSLQPTSLDFEDETLQDFDNSLNPISVSNVAGAFPGDLGVRQLRLDEDAAFTPTITFRDFSGSNATQLRFDFEFVTAAGSPDTLVASLFDPITGAPLLAAGILGPGDAAFLEATSSENLLAPGVTATLIPEPSSLLLMAFGVLGFLGIRMSHHRSKQPSP